MTDAYVTINGGERVPIFGFSWQQSMPIMEYAAEYQRMRIPRGQFGVVIAEAKLMAMVADLDTNSSALVKIVVGCHPVCDEPLKIKHRWLAEEEAGIQIESLAWGSDFTEWELR